MTVCTLTGASGVGKTSIARILLNFRNIDIVPSVTTRNPRPSDLDGEYKYVSEDKFQRMVEKEKFLWHVGVHGNRYGTTIRDVNRALKNKKRMSVMILVPDVLSDLICHAQNLFIEGHEQSKVIPFYILAPSDENVSRERLRKRGDSEQDIEKRINDCKEWDARAMACTDGIEYVLLDNDSDYVMDVAFEILRYAGMDTVSRKGGYGK